MTWLPYALAVYLFLVGLYGVVRSRNLIHLALCLTVTQSATYVFLLALGYRRQGSTPVLTPGGAPPERFVDPLVQAMAVTDIVVSATVTALLLALAVQVHKRTGTLDPGELTAQRG